MAETESPEPKRHRPGDTFEIRLTFAAGLSEGTFPRAFLSGPNSREEKFQTELATAATISPERDGNAVILKGTVPTNAEDGLYDLKRVDILHSLTGMDDAKKVKSLTWIELPGYAIMVERPKPPKADQIPLIIRIE